MRVLPSTMILHMSETAVPVPLTRCTDSNLSMAAVVPHVLIIVDSLLWLRGFFFFFFLPRVRGVKTDNFLPLEQPLVTKTQP